jgi:hypothetical protein
MVVSGDAVGWGRTPVCATFVLRSLVFAKVSLLFIWRRQTTRTLTSFLGSAKCGSMGQCCTRPRRAKAPQRGSSTISTPVVCYWRADAMRGVNFLSGNAHLPLSHSSRTRIIKIEEIHNTVCQRLVVSFFVYTPGCLPVFLLIFADVFQRASRADGRLHVLHLSPPRLLSPTSRWTLSARNPIRSCCSQSS